MATIALCVICKNEEKNLPNLLASVEGCFDEIHITDTGSTDGTIAYLKSRPDVTLHHFEWINDFAAARNYSFSHAKTDYIMWLDCDDILETKESFLEWKNNILVTSNYWLATYHYGMDGQGNPQCSFMRERVLKNNMGFEWLHFVHEGIPPASNVAPVRIGYATSWHVKHVRTQEDIKADRNRNLNIFEINKAKLKGNDRMQYYYGKELFEAQKYLDAYNQLKNSIDLPQLEGHDKILCVQYACMSAMLCNQFKEAIELAYRGLVLAPHRAEFYVIIGDCHLKQNKFDDAIPSYIAAAYCFNPSAPNSPVKSAIFSDPKAYGHYPRCQLARLFFKRGEINNAKRWLEEGLQLGPDEETGVLYAELLNAERQMSAKPVETLEKVDEYVITCPHIAPYLWDEEVYKERGIGGSETAAVRMARLIHQKTGKKVTVFNEREKTLEVDGVHYVSHKETMNYLNKYVPIAHIAWRHNLKLTNAPTYLWCHDLICENAHQHQNFDKILALSTFHKDLMKHVYAIPEEKIRVTRNGIDLERFQGVDFTQKDPNKIVFSSSPDRGLDRAIRVVEKAREISGRDLSLHVFYGFNNMEKLGKHQDVAILKKLISDRPWVRSHGNVSQSDLVQHLKDASVWLYPTEFLETFCITALEMVSCGVFPLVRAVGALPYTLEGLPGAVIDRDCVTEEEVGAWAMDLIMAPAGLSTIPDMSKYSWDSVADEWLSWIKADSDKIK